NFDEEPLCGKSLFRWQPTFTTGNVWRHDWKLIGGISSLFYADSRTVLTFILSQGTTAAEVVIG
ncbi:hypothetical protein L9F63_024610, partial [Diploptera punctata]